MAESLIIRIAGDATKFQQELDKVSESTEDLQNHFKEVGKVASAAFAATGAAIAFSVKQFADAERITAQTNAILKATGSIAGVTASQVDELANSLSLLTVFSDEAIKEGENILLTYTNIGASVFPRATAATLDLATRLGTDAAGAARALGKALQDPEQGLTALKRAGVLFTDAQSAMIKQMVALNDVAGAQKIILDQVESSIGGLAKETAKGIDGSFKRLINTYENIAEAIGGQFAPAVQKALDVMNSTAIAFKENEQLVRALGIALGGAFVASGVVASVSALGVAVTYLPVASALAAKGFALLTGPIGALVIGVAGAVAIFNALYEAKKRAAFDKEAKASGSATAGVNPALAEMVRKAEEEKAREHQKKIQADQNEAIQSKLNTERLALNLSLEQLRGANSEELALIKQRNEVEMAMRTELDAEKKATQGLLLEELNLQINESSAQRFEGAMAFEESMSELEKQYGLERFDRTSKDYEDMNKAAQKNYLSQSQMAASFRLTQFQEEQKNKQLHYNETQKFGKLTADFNQLMRSDELKRTRSGFDELAQMTRSKNETLKAIGKAAAIVNITIKTAEGALNAYNAFAWIPLVGPGLGMAAAAAIIAFGAEQIGDVAAMASGGIVSGGTPGIDSVPTMLMPGELVVPQQNFDEVINAVSAQRGTPLGTEIGNAGEQRVLVEIAFSGDASQVLTARQIEDNRLGLSRV